ncbi:MAG: ATP-grasp domain-containing protein, partial [Bacteroidales bacterium]|nr:ATP-grasp domain-containing protein [Bacteroidales bacterium]
PIFVKPNSNGSSVGVSKVNLEEELQPALEKAFMDDEFALIESFIKGREIGCGVFEFKGRMIVLPLTEIISKNEFFDYDAKYTKGKSDEITPADVDEDIDLEIKALAAQLYNRLSCRGFVRFDFILTDEDIYFLEVNTVPGMSAASIIPQQAEVMGISLSDFFGMAIENVI